MTTHGRPQQWPRGPANALHLAANDGSTMRMLALLSSGLIDINQGDPDGWTPLMYGASKGLSQVVEILLNNGADVLIVDDHRFSALHLAIDKGVLSVTSLLVRAGADLHATTSKGYTALHLAAATGRSEVAAALIEAGSNVNTRLPDTGETPLYIAAWNGVGAVRLLLRANADALLFRTALGTTLFPMNAAAYHGHVDVLREMLQQRGIEGCGDDFSRVNALFATVAFGSCSPRTVRLLVDAGVDTKSTVRIADPRRCEANESTLLALTNRSLLEKKVYGKDATEKQLNGLQGVRRLLMRVEGVHAVSWLWYSARALKARAADGTGKGETMSMPVSTMLPILRRRAARRRLLLPPLFRHSAKP